MFCVLVHAQHGLKRFYSTQDGCTISHIRQKCNSWNVHFYRSSQTPNISILDELWLFYSHNFIHTLFCYILLLCGIHFMTKSNSNCLYFAARAFCTQTSQHLLVESSADYWMQEEKWVVFSENKIQRHLSRQTQTCRKVWKKICNPVEQCSICPWLLVLYWHL